MNLVLLGLLLEMENDPDLGGCVTFPSDSETIQRGLIRPSYPLHDV